MMQCKNCRFWTRNTDFNYPKNIPVGKCTRVKLFWDCTDWSDEVNENGDYLRILNKSAEGNLAFVQDGSDYHAELITLGEFGCVQFN